MLNVEKKIVVSAIEFLIIFCCVTRVRTAAGALVCSVILQAFFYNIAHGLTIAIWTWTMKLAIEALITLAPSHSCALVKLL